MDKVKDTVLVDFRIFKRIRFRESTGKRERYFVLAVQGDEFYYKTFSGLIIHEFIPLLFETYCSPYRYLVKNGFIHDPSYRFRKSNNYVLDDDGSILF